MSEVAKFFTEVAARIERLEGASDLHAASREWLRLATEYGYAHNFTWLGRPIIQVPQDVMAMQEILWRVKPAAVVETGVAHGGSLVFHASMLELAGGDGLVVGVDIDVRAHNRREIEAHPLSRRIRLVEGSSIDPRVVAEVYALVGDRRPVVVLLDSMHTHAHVLAELRAYSPLVSPGSYLVVYDTAIDDFPAGAFPDRPWGPGDNPKTAVREFLAEDRRFAVDTGLEAKLSITVAPGGYLRRLED